MTPLPWKCPYPAKTRGNHGYSEHVGDPDEGHQETGTKPFWITTVFGRRLPSRQGVYQPNAHQHEGDARQGRGDAVTRVQTRPRFLSVPSPSVQRRTRAGLGQRRVPGPFRTGRVLDRVRCHHGRSILRGGLPARANTGTAPNSTFRVIKRCSGHEDVARPVGRQASTGAMWQHQRLPGHTNRAFTGLIRTSMY